MRMGFNTEVVYLLMLRYKNVEAAKNYVRYLKK